MGGDCGDCVLGGEAGWGAAVTFSFAGVAEHAASDQFCEHLSCFLQAVGRCVGARLFSLFFSCLSSSDFPLFFSLFHLTVTATSSPDLSALHLCQLFTFTPPSPPPTPHLMSGHGMQPRLQAWPPYGLTVRTFQAKQMFRIQPNITLDPCATMNYSLCFSLAGRASDGMRGLG